MSSAHLAPTPDVKHEKSIAMERKAAANIGAVRFQLLAGCLKLLGACKRCGSSIGSKERCVRSVSGAYVAGADTRRET